VTGLLWIAAIILLALALKCRRPAPPPPRLVHRAPALTAQYAAAHQAKLAAAYMKQTTTFMQARPTPGYGVPYDMLAAYRPKLES
jgi:hypothetical protein